MGATILKLLFLFRKSVYVHMYIFLLTCELEMPVRLLVLFYRASSSPHKLCWSEQVASPRGHTKGQELIGCWPMAAPPLPPPFCFVLMLCARLVESPVCWHLTEPSRTSHPSTDRASSKTEALPYLRASSPPLPVPLYPSALTSPPHFKMCYRNQAGGPSQFGRATQGGPAGPVGQRQEQNFYWLEKVISFFFFSFLCSDASLCLSVYISFRHFSRKKKERKNNTHTHTDDTDAPSN